MKKIFKIIATMFAATVLLSACEQETYDPNLTVAPGGGTITTFKAYTLAPATPDDVYGRVVFYKYSPKVTLVQVGLYNTLEGSNYTAAIFNGALIGASPTVLIPLDDVDGATGAFGSNKYFVISSDGFYDALNDYDANVKIMLESSTVSEGDIGANADPVEEK